MSKLSGQLGDKSGRCKYLNACLKAYDDNLIANPTIKPSIPKGYESFQEFIEAEKNQFECE